MTSPPPPPGDQNTNTLGPIIDTPSSNYYKADGTMSGGISDRLAGQGALDESSRETSNEKLVNYKIATSGDNCIEDNKRWDSNNVSSNNNDCILNNKNIIDKYDSNNIKINYYPIRDPLDQSIPNNITSYKFNIEDYICVPSIDNITNQTIVDCDTHHDKSTCTAPGTQCEWIENPLRDSIFNWSTDHKIKFNKSNDATSNCPIEYTDSSNNEISIPVDKITGNNYITTNIIPSTSTGLVFSDILDASYINNCSIIDIKDNSNIFDETSTCLSSGEVLNGSEYKSTPDHCHQPNIAYCPHIIGNEISDLCSNPDDAEDITLSSGNIVNGCPYYDSRSDAEINNKSADYLCFGNINNHKGTKFLCDPEFTNPYNCHKNISSGDNGTCTSTGYITQPNITQQPADTGNIYKYGGEGGTNTNFKNFTLCDPFNENDADNSHKEKRCNMIGQDKAHWGKLCELSTENIKIPVKHVCDVANPVNGARRGATWAKQHTGTDLEYGCYSDDGNKYDEQTVCGFLVTDNENENTLIDSYIAQESDTELDLDFRTTRTPLTLYEGDDVYDGQDTCIIDFWEESEEKEESDYRDICENTNNHSIGYNYYEYPGNRIGVCKYINNEAETGSGDTESTCESNNYKIISEYSYNNVGTSDSLGPERVTNKPDIPTTWTGGEVSYDDGIHHSECSPSIMSSCNVTCNSGYGGGGEYICQYNNSGGNICGDINSKTYPNEQQPNVTKQHLCEIYPSCNYDSSNDTCSDEQTVKNDGHLEWMGSPCYKIDNTAFSHGIAKLPALDDIISPAARVFIFMLLYILL